jgi:hypothetical protein
MGSGRDNILVGLDCTRPGACTRCYTAAVAVRAAAAWDTFAVVREASEQRQTSGMRSCVSREMGNWMATYAKALLPSLTDDKCYHESNERNQSADSDACAKSAVSNYVIGSGKDKRRITDPDALGFDRSVRISQVARGV